MNELGPAARAVVEAGRAGDDPTPGDRSRVRAALMASIAAGAAATVAGEGAAAAGAAKGAATAGAAAVTLGWGWKALYVGLALAGAVGTGVAVRSIVTGVPIGARAPGPLVPIEAPLRSAPSSAPIGAAVVAAPLSSGTPAAPPPAASAARRLLPSQPVTTGETPQPSEPEPAAKAPPAVDPLVAETRGLGEAHGALKDGDPARALALLDAQGATYADGQLREERAAARVLALCKLGRADEARALAARFLAENPRSLLADRVRSACAAGDPR
jgi:hypothetical protein